MYIDTNDILYSADSESSFGSGVGGIPNPGWKPGSRIGSVTDGQVTAFIPDPEWEMNVRGTTAAEGGAADAHGNVYGAEVGPCALRSTPSRSRGEAAPPQASRRGPNQALSRGHARWV